MATSQDTKKPHLYKGNKPIIIGIISLVLIILFSVFLFIRSGPFAGKAVEISVPGMAGIIEQRAPFVNNIPLVIDVYPLQDANGADQNIYGFDIEVIYPSSSLEVLPGQVISLFHGEQVQDGFTIKYKDTELDADNHKLTIQGFRFGPYQQRFTLQGLNLKIKEGAAPPTGTIRLTKVQLSERNPESYITSALLDTRESNWELGGAQGGDDGVASVSRPRNQAGEDIQEIAQGQDFSLDLFATLPADKKVLVGQFQVQFDPTKVDAPTFEVNRIIHLQRVEGETAGNTKTFTFMVIPSADAATVNVEEYALAGSVSLGNIYFHVKADAAEGETEVSLSSLTMYEEDGDEISFTEPAAVAVTVTAGDAEELCAVAGDEDADGQENCADSDCAADPACQACTPYGDLSRDTLLTSDDVTMLLYVLGAQDRAACGGANEVVCDYSADGYFICKNGVVYAMADEDDRIHANDICQMNACTPYGDLSRDALLTSDDVTMLLYVLGAQDQAACGGAGEAVCDYSADGYFICKNGVVYAMADEDDRTHANDICS